MTRALAAIAMACVGLGADVFSAGKFDEKKAAFALAFHGEVSPYRHVAAVTLPAGTIAFEAIGGPPGDYRASTKAGTLIQQASRRWKWIAPERSGTYDITFHDPAKKDSIEVHAFVLVPAAAVRGGVLNGYRIGAYPPPPPTNTRLYARPAGFIEVTPDNEDARVSPHFALKQFLCKEDTTRAYPKYVVLNERLPLKLEAVLELVNDLGFHVDTLRIMSAYRTPYYNHAIGDVKYSMHQWGGAADIYVDPTNRDRMEDLNHDGQVDVADAKWLHDAIEGLLSRSEFRRLQGGMGFYPATAAHPPFVHVDVRGTPARWKG
jgi:hypothetical protein